MLTVAQNLDLAQAFQQVLADYTSYLREAMVYMDACAGQAVQTTLTMQMLQGKMHLRLTHCLITPKAPLRPPTLHKDIFNFCTSFLPSNSAEFAQVRLTMTSTWSSDADALLASLL